MAYSPLCPPAAPVVSPTQVLYNHIYVPQPVEVVHPIQIVNQYHCVPVPYHTVQCTVVDEKAAVCSHKRKKRAKARSRK